jgi:DNA-binding transcriptional MocR family regulator
MSRVGVEAASSQVIVCGGSQQALALCMATLVRPGDTILCEDFTYPGLLDAANMFGVRTHGLAQDESGLLPDALDRACRETNARVLFMVPTLQNPTNSIMPEQRRREIVEIARRHDLTIVEDDVYGYLPVERPVPIVSLAPERTLYVTSVSKCLAPGLRTAWLVAPEHLIPRLTDSLHGLAIAQPPLTTEVVRLWVENGTADRLIAWHRQETAVRQDMAMEKLDGLEFRHHPASFHILLHLPSPWRAEAFAAAALDQGVRVIPASLFSANRDNAPPAVRISLSPNGDREELARALTMIAELARTMPRVGRAVV